MQYTPVIPPSPNSQRMSSPHARPPAGSGPYSPSNHPPPPSWMPPQQFMSPFMSTHPMMGTPGSYFIPPTALPPQGAGSPVAPVGSGGLPADWTGFPNGVPVSPMVHPGSPGSHQQTPFMPPGAGYMPQGAGFMPPGTGYNAFQQPLPGGYPAPPGAFPPMWNPMMFTPYGMPGAIPGGWPTTPFVPGGANLPPQPGQMHPAQTGGSAPPPAHALRPQDVTEFDKVDKFAEGPHYGPVLEPLLVKKVRAKPEVNPLLLPPPDGNDRDYLRWNVLFPTGQCQRSSDPPYRSWAAGRGAPATWPRVSSLRLISRHIPWPVEIKASDPASGVTCGDVIEGIFTYMNGRVSQRQFDTASDTQKRTLSEAFYHNRSTAHGVPGGRLPQTLLRFDWLGQDTMFGGVVVNEDFVKEACGGLLPCIFELKCLRRYPMSEREIMEQEQREAEADTRSRHGRRSRGTSRATSRATSQAPSSTSTRNMDDDDDE